MGRSQDVRPVLVAENSEWRVLNGHSHRVLDTPSTEATRAVSLGFPDGSVVKNPPANAGDKGSICG